MAPKGFLEALQKQLNMYWALVGDDGYHACRQLNEGALIGVFNGGAPR